MAEDVATTETADPAVEVEGTAPPSLLDRIAMNEDERAALPDDARAISLEDVDVAVTAAREQARLDAEVALRTQMAQAETVRQQNARAQQAATADQQADIEYFQRLQKDKRSEDEVVRAAALADLAIPENDDTYIRGGAAARTATLQQQATESMARLYNAMSAELSGGDYADVLPAAGSPAWIAMQVQLTDFDGKGGVARYILESGRALGQREAYEQGQTEGARTERIELGQQGAPQMTQATASQGANYTNPSWVQEQMKNPEWAQQMSPDGKQTNIARVRKETVPQIRR